MELRQLEIFASVADTGSFSRAAERLYITQPTVSAHIRHLEDELGTLLFKRSTRNLTVSEAGECLYPYAVMMLDLRAKAERELRDITAGRKVIRIGASTVPSAYILPSAILDYGQKHPEVSFEITKSDSIGVVQRIAHGELDLGLVGTRTDTPGCSWLPLTEDELVLVTPANAHFRSLRDSSADLKELMREPVLLREPSSGTRRETEHLLRRAGINPSSLNTMAVFNDPEAIRNSIVRGIGVSIMSRRTVEELAGAEKVLIFPLDGLGAVRQLYLVRRDDIPATQHACDFAGFLLQGKAVPAK